jgi:hypothetical protein
VLPRIAWPPISIAACDLKVHDAGIGGNAMGRFSERALIIYLSNRTSYKYILTSTALVDFQAQGTILE